MSVRRLLATVGLAGTLLLSALAPAVAATDDAAADESTTPVEETDTVTFGIAPAGPERADDRPYVSVAAAPGSVIYEHVAIINQDDQPIELDVYSGDVIMAEGGGLSVTTRAEGALEAGSWIAVQGPTTVTVPAQTRESGYGFVIVPLTITIPANATPGDHVGGLVASLRTSGQGGENAPTVDLEQRVAARIYVQVTGEVTAGLAITGIDAEWTGASVLGTGAVTVRYTLTNTGNLQYAVEPSVTVAGPFGLLPGSTDADRIDVLLPGGSVEQSVTVDGVWALFRETVTIDAVAQPSAAGADPGLGTISATTSVTAIPWLALAAVVLLLAVLVWWGRSRRRRRRRQAAAPVGTRRARRGAGGATESGPVPAHAGSGTPDHSTV